MPLTSPLVRFGRPEAIPYMDKPARVSESLVGKQNAETREGSRHGLFSVPKQSSGSRKVELRKRGRTI